MTNIKISKSGKYYLCEKNNRLIEDQNNIIKISANHFALFNQEDNKNKWAFFNINTQSIDLIIIDKWASKLKLDDDVFTIDLENSFEVYDKYTLKQLFSINKKEDRYNFHYIGNGYSIYENSIYKENKPIDSLNNFSVIFENEKTKYRIIKVEDISLFYINDDNYELSNKKFTILNITIPENVEQLYVVSKKHKNKNVFFFKSENSFTVISGNQIIYKGDIDDDGGNKIFDIANYEMINFSVGNAKYVITNNHLLNGPYEIYEFEHNRIFKCKEYTLYYKDKCLIKYTHISHSLSFENSNFEFNLHLNIKTDILFKEANEYAKLSIGDEYYYFNDKINEFKKLENGIEIIPYIFENKIYFLDENLIESIVEPTFDILDLIISDYTYYKRQLYLILRNEETPEPEGIYTIYDVKNNKVIKTFESFIEFTSHREFYLTNNKYISSSFIYTLEEKSNKLIKLPFKTRGISIESNSFQFTNMSYQTVSMPIEEAIYIKE